MPVNDRRSFLKLLAAGSAAAALHESIAKALAIPAYNKTGTIRDVQHIVFLMQENRSFDHYYGTMRGVRGFGDPRAVTLPTGKSVFHQPSGGGYVLPFHPDAPNLGLQFIQDLPHDWDSTHATFGLGAYDTWVPNKGSATMAYLTRDDIPYHYALADAFTVCDGYHCSLLGPTDPNRYHMFTGWVGNDGAGGGPVVDNAEAGYGWSTFPERLEAAGVSWKVYQDVGEGLTAAGYWGYTDNAYIGNYGDNSLLYFHQYQNAAPNTPLALKARTGTNVAQGGTLFDILRADIQAGTLPQVSWIVAPEAYCEHPNWPVNYGAWYISQVLDALTANPDVWSKTVLILTYDENDGFFDHMVPPTPPASPEQGQSTIETTDDIFPGSASYPSGPYGLGVRVPTLVISPWSKGGWVDSQVFDHTSLIRFVEARFGQEHPGVFEPNITPWRRAVAGDLTSAFDFAAPHAAPAALPSTAAYVPPDALRHSSYEPAVPAEQSLPSQEPGLRPARALPYEAIVTGAADLDAGAYTVVFSNTGPAAIVFHVRSLADANPFRTYTVGAGDQVQDTWDITSGAGYDVSVYGPNGFLRAFKGGADEKSAAISATESYDNREAWIVLDVLNRSDKAATAEVFNAYTGETRRIPLAAGQSVRHSERLAAFHGWYDLTVTVEGDAGFRQQLAGHVETGAHSASDPLLSERRWGSRS